MSPTSTLFLSVVAAAAVIPFLVMAAEAGVERAVSCILQARLLSVHIMYSWEAEDRQRPRVKIVYLICLRLSAVDMGDMLNMASLLRAAMEAPAAGAVIRMEAALVDLGRMGKVMMAETGPAIAIHGVAEEVVVPEQMDRICHLVLRAQAETACRIRSAVLRSIMQAGGGAGDRSIRCGWRHRRRRCGWRKWCHGL